MDSLFSSKTTVTYWAIIVPLILLLAFMAFEIGNVFTTILLFTWMGVVVLLFLDTLE